MARRLRALRGATTVDADDATLICAATRELLMSLASRNELELDDVVSAIFTVTPDLRSEFPARAARDIGWDHIPLLCTTEIPVPGALPLCIRVLLHIETGARSDSLKHVYLRGAQALRPDLLSE
jgi:chorismate mutase